MLAPLSPIHRIALLILFGAAISINLLNWCYTTYTLGGFTHIPFFFWEAAALLALLFWNPKGIRLVLFALMGFFIFQLIFSNFFVGGLSNLPYWYLFRDVYQFLELSDWQAFIIESVLLFCITVSLFPASKKQHTTDILDQPD